MFGIGASEAIVLGLIAVLLFGKRLPEVARTLGKHYHEFKRGLQDIQSEFSQASRSVDRTMRETTNNLLTYEEEDYSQPTAPQFEVPPPSDEA